MTEEQHPATEAEEITTMYRTPDGVPHESKEAAEAHLAELKAKQAIAARAAEIEAKVTDWVQNHSGWNRRHQRRLTKTMVRYLTSHEADEAE